MSNVVQFKPKSAPTPEWLEAYRSDEARWEAHITMALNQLLRSERIMPSQFDPRDVLLLRETIAAMIMRFNGKWHPVQDVADSFAEFADEDFDKR